MNKKILTLSTVLISLTCITATAIEPFTDRARLLDIQSTLLLPDRSELTVDMTFDCGSKFENTGVIVTSEQGAKLVAASYFYLYGEEAAEYVMNLWNNKAKVDDPRKPTFLIISPSKDADISYKQKGQVPKAIKQNIQFKGISNETEINKFPIVMASCGASVHPPRGNQ